MDVTGEEARRVWSRVAVATFITSLIVLLWASVGDVSNEVLAPALIVWLLAAVAVGVLAVKTARAEGEGFWRTVGHMLRNVFDFLFYFSP